MDANRIVALPSPMPGPCSTGFPFRTQEKDAGFGDVGVDQASMASAGDMRKTRPHDLATLACVLWQEPDAGTMEDPSDPEFKVCARGLPSLRLPDAAADVQSPGAT